MRLSRLYQKTLQVVFWPPCTSVAPKRVPWPVEPDLNTTKISLLQNNKKFYSCTVYKATKCLDYMWNLVITLRLSPSWLSMASLSSM